MGGGLGEGGLEVAPGFGSADFFSCLFQSLFRVCFLFGFSRVLEWSFGARMVHLGATLGSFGGHFGDF